MFISILRALSSKMRAEKSGKEEDFFVFLFSLSLPPPRQRQKKTPTPSLRAPPPLDSLVFPLLIFISHDGKRALFLQVSGPKKSNEADARERQRRSDERSKNRKLTPGKKENARVVVRLRPLSSGEEAAKAAGAAAAGSRCAQPTPCGKGLVLRGAGNAVSSTTTATRTTTPTAAAASSSSSNDNTTSSSFSFPDGVLGEGASQREAYEAVTEVVEGVLLGKSASIIAYGERRA